MTASLDITERFSLDVTLRSVALTRGERVLFENLSLSLQSGGLLYVLGENGIGKTSLLLALAGLLKPHRGQIEFPETHPPSLASSLLIHPDGASRGLSVSEDLHFVAKLSDHKTDVSEMLKRTGLSDLAQNRTETLSLGQRKRLSLAKLLMGRRPLWLLDEPFSALDTKGRVLFAEEIALHLNRGGIAVIASHLPTEIPGHTSKTLRLKAAK